MEPNIRIKGFDGDWEERSLGDIFSFQNGFNGGKEVYGSGIPLISVMDVLDDDFITYNKIRGKAEVSEEERERFSVNYGDVLFQRSSENVEDAGTSNVYLDQDHTAVFGGFVIRGRGISEYDPKFMKYCLSAPMVRNQFMKKAQGAQHVNISQEVLQGIRIFEPSDAEQRKISEMFSCLGQQISLQQQKVSDLKELKKYMLQKMFPKDGEKVPEIRFSGFEGEWEQRKFGEITELKSASRVHKEEWTSSGVPFYRSSDVMSTINGIENEKAFISVELYEKLSSVSGKLEKGDVLITGGGSVGNPYIVLNNEPLYTKDADLLWIKNQGRFDEYFIYEFFFSPAFRNYLSSISHVGTIAHYTITQLSDTPVSLPSKGEQKKIGAYFSQLDSLITHHQRKHDTLLEFKAYLLQNMFPKEG